MISERNFNLHGTFPLHKMPSLNWEPFGNFFWEPKIIAHSTQKLPLGTLIFKINRSADLKNLSWNIRNIKDP